MSATETAQRLLALLPAIYSEDPFLGQYLAPFEQTLGDLEQRIDTIAQFFDPMTPVQDPEFLPWLASWMAFTLRADLDRDKQRAFLANVIPLYRSRGTKGNLQNLLSIFTRGTTGAPPIVTENQTDSGAEAPHFFHVKIALARGTPDFLLTQDAIAKALIELEKPAHTTYTLETVFPTMQVGKFSTVGIDTLLGTGEDA
jgi:phage tail-like protein